MRGLKEYQTASVESVVGVASPYKITAMLMDGVIKNINIAIYSTKNNEYERRSEAISKVQSIIFLLASTLDDNHAPELCENLRRMYDYINTCMSDFMLEKDFSKAESALLCMKEIKLGWDQIEKFDQKGGANES